MDTSLRLWNRRIRSLAGIVFLVMIRFIYKKYQAYKSAKEETFVFIKNAYWILLHVYYRIYLL